MTDIIIVAVLLIILGGAAWYVIRAKKKGKKCIGCPGGCSSCRSCASYDKEKSIMVKITMHVEGMMCAHCEAHMNDAIKAAFGVKKVTSSHEKKMTEIISKEPISEDLIQKAVEETGYSVSDIKAEEYKRFLFF